MSLRTSRWFLLQKEQRRGSPSPFLRAISIHACSRSAPLLAARNDLVEDPVFLRLAGRHDEITVRIRVNPLPGLTRVPRKDVAQPVLDLENLLRLDRDVRGLAGKAPHRLANEHPRVRQPAPPAGPPR